jgi:glycosyltransferase involved in cell wall biosynthesis
LPKSLSRFLECTVSSKQFGNNDVLLVLGDIPLNVASKQVVLVQTSHLLAPNHFSIFRSKWKYAVSRAIFSANSSKVDAFVVQSDVMKEGLERSYPSVRGRVHIISQPPPNWILRSKRPAVRQSIKDGLNLFYPAAFYPHKNHSLLSDLKIDPQLRAAVKQIILTIKKPDLFEFPTNIVKCVGMLDQEEMIQTYDASHAVAFLSKQESFGFPLLEAMWLNLPVICPDLSYARWMCGCEAIYFDPESPESLKAAIVELHSRMLKGWRPDWTEPLRKFPSNWANCADAFIDICQRV